MMVMMMTIVVFALEQAGGDLFVTLGAVGAIFDLPAIGRFFV
jgi:hypothetical protein